MAAIAGGWWSEPGPHGPDALRSMARALERQGDGQGHVVWRAPVGMAWRPIAGSGPTPRAPGTALHPSGLLGAWDGRLDDRDALARQLGLRPEHVVHDLDVVLEAYAQQGEAALGRLVGDWSLSLWDARRRRLLLARDGCGTRPLYLRRGAGVVRWASTIEALRSGADSPAALDEAWLLGYLTGDRDVTRTPWRDIEAVRPGCVLCLGEGGVREQRLWRPEPRHAPPPRDDRALEARFAAAFEQAVARRLPADGPVGVELSGGLDSSSIAGMAAHVLGPRAAACLRPVSVVYRESTMADERRYVEAVERHLGLSSLRVWQEDHPLLAELGTPAYEAPGPYEAIKLRERAITEHLRTAGATSLLRGTGGDQLLLSEADAALPLADALQQHGMRAIVSSLRSAADGGPLPYLSLARQAARLAMPSWARLGPTTRAPAWLHPRLAPRLRLWSGPRRAHADIRLPSLRQRVAELEHAIDVVALGHDRGPVPLALAYPFLDRDLIELCLSLPLDQLARGRTTRSIQRRSLARLLPPAVLGRRGKATMQDALVQALRRAMPELGPVLARPRVAELGLVEPKAFHAALQRARYQGTAELMPLLRVIDLELWLRAHERPAARERPAAP